MNLPNYFMADLHPRAEVTPALVLEACYTIRRNRSKYLATRSVDQIIDLLCEVGRWWCDPAYPLRQQALAEGPAQTGFSRETLEQGIESFFCQFKPELFRAWIDQDFGNSAKLRSLQPTDAEKTLGKSSGVVCPELILHVASGNLPNPAWHSLVTGLLLGSAQIMKCASGASLLPRLFGHSLYEADSKIASTIELVEWKGGSASLEEPVIQEADAITATGSDEALSALRERVPASKKFVSYGHRVSFAFIGKGGLRNPSAVADLAARDVCAWDQQGCLSPHVVYLETGSMVSGSDFAELLARALSVQERRMPRGPLSVREASVIASRRAMYEIRAANSLETKMHRSHNTTAWTVIFEADPLFQPSCLNRFIYVKEARDLDEALRNCETIRPRVSTVGLHDSPERLPDLAGQLARWGVPRVCPLGKMQQPSLAWRHDGHPALGSLVTWCDWELL